MYGKDKPEQIFLLLMSMVVCFALICATGCGGRKSCERPKCGMVSNDSALMIGASVPGCGGLLTSGSGWGCDTYGLWSQSIKGVVGYASREKLLYLPVEKKEDKKSNDDQMEQDNDKVKSKVEPEKVVDVDRALYLGIDDQYYVNKGCGGCGSDKLKSCYAVVALDSPISWLVAVGNSPKGEIYLGCDSGCGQFGACGDKEPGRAGLSFAEFISDIR